MRILAILGIISLIIFAMIPSSFAQGDKYVFLGSGWGHGVGMCQYGARGLAVKGFSHREILSYYYTNTRVEKRPCPQTARIGLIEGITEIHLRAESGSFNVATAQTPIEGANIKAGETWIVALNQTGAFTIKTPSGQILNNREYGGPNEPLIITGDSPQSVLRLPQNKNCGLRRLQSATPLEIRSYSASAWRIRAVVTSQLEEYLCGLAEVPGSWPAEAVKAQAVAARSYVVKNMGKHSRDGYDLCDETHCQYFVGFDKEKDSGWVNAVRETSGELLLWGSEIVNSVYCSSCGGHTDNNEDVWFGSPVPYLRGVPCPYCLDEVNPNASWIVTLSREEIENKLAARGLQIGRLNYVDLSDRSPSGRVRKAMFTGTASSKTVTGESLRGLLGIKSAMVRIASQSNFTEYVLLSNFSKTDAKARVKIFTNQGEGGEVDITVPALTRKTIKVNDYLPFKDVSARITSDIPLVAERSMYFRYAGKIEGGTCSEGMPRVSKSWYFAEGYTGGSFDTWILIFNPNEKKTKVTVHLSRDDGHVVKKEMYVPPLSRATLSVDSVKGFEAASFASHLTSSLPVVAERSVYFVYSGRQGGHSSPGSTQTSTSWHFAEGYTVKGFDTYILVGNPGTKPANVLFKIYLPRGESKRLQKTVRARSRYTLYLNDIIPGSEAAVSITSDEGIVAERAMYFDYGGIRGGSCALGSTRMRKEWYLAEGYVSDTFDEYVLVSNPEDATASIKFTLIGSGGILKEIHTRVPAKSRHTLKVNDHVSNSDVSVRITSKNGVKLVAERAMYFDYEGIKDGHAAGGIPAPSTIWYFAEGYTGD